MDNVDKIVFLVFMVLIRLGNAKHVCRTVYNALILLIVTNAHWAIISQQPFRTNVYYSKFWFMGK